MGKNKSLKRKASSRSPKVSTDELSLSEKHLKRIAWLLYEKFKDEKRTRKYAPVKEVLTLLVKVGVVAMVLAAPKTTIFAKDFFREEKDWEAWKRFNPAYLRRTISRLEKQKQVEVVEKEGYHKVKITKRGKIKILKYALSELKIKAPKKWDGKWRLIIYDIPTKFKKTQEFFRMSLKRLSFYPLQKSVYLFPYPCEDEIEYLRQLLNIEQYVRILVVEKIEHDKTFRTYFDLD